jgi:hypothetical protein
MGDITANDLYALWSGWNWNTSSSGAYNIDSTQPNLEAVAGKNYWPDLLSAVEQNIDVLTGNLQPQIGSSWTGTAAELASGQLTTTATSLIHTHAQLTQVYQGLTDFWQNIEGYARELGGSYDDAGDLSSGYFTLENDGTLSYGTVGSGSVPTVAPDGGPATTSNTISPNALGVANDIVANSPNIASTFFNPGSQAVVVVPSGYLNAIENAINAALAAKPAQGQAFQQDIQYLASAIDAWRSAASSQFQSIVSQAKQADNETADLMGKLMPGVGGPDLLVKTGHEVEHLLDDIF